MFSFLEHFAELNLVHKVGALVLIYPLRNLLGFKLAGVSEGLRISFIWKSQVQVMGGVLDVDGSGFWADVESYSTCLPGVELTVGEDDIRGFHEVFGGVDATEVLKSPIVLGAETVGCFTVSSVGLVAPA